jgi:hypothetical protein
MATDRKRSSGEDARRERRRAAAKAWRERNADRVRQSRKDWKARNPERARELNRESMRRRHQRNLRVTRQNAAANERSREWKRTHPERARETQRRWREAHPERVREHHRRYYQRHGEEIAARTQRYRDANESAVKQRRADWAAANRERITEYQRRYRADPDRYAKTLQSNREARRVQRRLVALELPPKRVHRTTAAERRANQTDAHQFFTSADARQKYLQIATLQNEIDRIAWNQADDLRRRAADRIAARERVGLSSGTVDDVAMALAAAAAIEHQPVDRLTTDDMAHVIANVRELHHRRHAATEARDLRHAIIRYVEQRTDWLRREAALENHMREAAGKPQVRIDVLAHHIAFHALKDRLPHGHLHLPDAMKVVNAAREAHPTLFDEPSGWSRTAHTDDSGIAAGAAG